MGNQQGLWFRRGFTAFAVAALVPTCLQITLAVDVPFNDPVVVEPGSVQNMASADLNNDGAADVVAITDNKLYWYQNSGSGSTTRHFIGEPDPPIQFVGVAAADGDGDGDTDIFLMQFQLVCQPPLPCIPVETTVVYVNSSGSGLTWEAGTPFPGTAIVVADMDGDGDDDSVVNGVLEGGIIWVDPSDGSAQMIRQDLFAEPVAAVDVDADCDVDVIAVSSTDGLVWLENVDGAGTAWLQHVAAGVLDTNVLTTGDIDRDGRTDVVLNVPATGELVWYRNPGNAGSWSEETVADFLDGPMSLNAGDVDGNGTTDVCAIANDGEAVVWYDNVQGSGALWTTHVVTETIADATVGRIVDLNGDHRADLVYSSESSGIQWWGNRLIRRSAFFPEQVAVTTTADGAQAVTTADLDDDGDLDVVSASANDNSVLWFENSADSPPSFTVRTVSTVATGARSVATGDLDGDGDPDVIAALESVDDIVWYENDGTPAIGSWTARNIAVGAAGVRSVDAGDIDCDGDVDVVSADYDAGRIRLWRNNGSSPPGWTVMSISPAGSGPTAVAIVDLDEDGQSDVVSSWDGDGAVRWHRNDLGSGTLWTTTDLATAIATANDLEPVDLNNDGAIDIVVAELGTCSPVFPFSCNGRVLWIPNGSTGAQEIDALLPRVTSVLAADLDVDGDLDVVATSASTSAFEFNAVMWYENLGGGDPAFVKRSVVSGSLTSGSVISSPLDVTVADLDRDGDPDVVSASEGDDMIAWYRNGGGQFQVTTDNVAPSNLLPAATDALLAVMVTHQGRTGDSDVELLWFDFLFEQSPGDPLDVAEGLALLEGVSLYRDDGDGVFELDQDLFIRTVSPPLLDSGVIRIGLNQFDDQDVVAVPYDEPGIFFLVVTLTTGAGSLDFTQFLATHLAIRARADDRFSDLALILEEPVDVASSIVALISSGDCNSDGHLDIDDWPEFAECLAGPEVESSQACSCADFNNDLVIDLADASSFQVFVQPLE